MGWLLRRLSAFVAGCAIGLALRGLSSKRPSPPPAPAPTEVASEEIAPPRGEGEPEGKGPSSAPSAGEVGVSKALSELLRSIPRERTLEGKGTIWGKVLTDRGEPLAQVRIELAPLRGPWPKPEDFGWRASEWSSLDRDAFTFLALGKQEEERKRTALTDERGAFRIEGLSEEIAYHAGASLEGWKIGPMAGWTPWLRCGEEVRFLATPAARPNFSVDCLLPDGRRPEKAEIRLKSGRRGSFGPDLEWTPHRREFSLPPRPYLVRAVAHIGDRTHLSPWIAVTIGIEPREPIALALSPDADPGIDGELHLPPGAPLEVIPIHIERIATPDDASRIGAGSSPRTVVDPKRSPRFSIDHLYPGLYYVAAFWGRQGPLAAEAIVELRAERVELALDLQPPEPSAGFRIAAYSPEGDPLSPERGFWAYLQGIEREGERCFASSTISLKRTRAPDGSFRFLPERDLDALEREGPLAWFLTVRSLDYGCLQIPFDPKKETEARADFRPPAFPTFVIEGYAEGGYRRGRLDVDLNGSLEGPFGRCFPFQATHGMLDASGRASLDPQQPGTYRVEIEYHGEAPGLQLWKTIHRSTVDLRSGPNELPIRLPPLHDLSVSCPTAQAGRKITLSLPWRLSGWSIEVPGDGVAIFRGLPDGEYLLRMEGPNGGEMGIVLPGQEAVEFHPSPFDAFAVAEVPNGSCTREVGIESGERIIGIGAELFQGGQELGEILEAYRDREEIYLIVESFDGSRAVPVNPAKLLADLAKGTLFIPTRRR